MNNHQTLSKHTITALVQDKPGVLNRVSSMFRRRGFNIASLAVGHSEEPELSRMTFVVEGDDRVVEQVTKHLNKLIDVIKVSDISEPEHRLAGARPSSGSTRTRRLAARSCRWWTSFEPTSWTLPQTRSSEVSGDEEKVDSLHELLKPFGIVEVMRTGTIALNRGMGSEGTPRRSSNGPRAGRKWGEASSV